jgi:hypothetical protein
MAPREMVRWGIAPTRGRGMKGYEMSSMTPAEFAVEVGSDGRTVRKFLRSITPKDEQPGKGSRWSLPGTKREVTKLRKQFTEWTAALEAKKAQDAEVEEPTDEVEDDTLDA